jgi:hypothetical protein
MPTIGIATYALSTVRQTINGLAFGITTVVLAPEQDDGTVAVVYLFYHPTTVVGYLVGSQLSAYFPREHLRGHLGVLQSENPLFVQWEIDQADPMRLSQFALTTGEEFVGEGLADMTPF